MMIAVLRFSTVTTAADYYVDSVSGSDSASGRTDQEAWRTLDRVNTAAIQPGDSVLFKKGGLWRGTLLPQSGAPGKPVLYSSYGEGEKPKIFCSVSLNDPNLWTKESENIWVTRVPNIKKKELPFQSFLSGVWHLHYENGAKASFEKETKDGKFTCRVRCLANGTAVNHIQLMNFPFHLSKGKEYLMTFKTNSNTDIKGVKFSMMNSAFPFSGYAGEFVIKINKGEQKHQLLFTTKYRLKNDVDDARLNISLGIMPKGATIQFSDFIVCEIHRDELGLYDDVGNIIIDGNRAAFKKWTKSDLKEQDNFWHDMTGDCRLYYFSDKNPAQKYKTLEAALRRHAVNHGGASQVIFDGFDVRYAGVHGFGGSPTAFVTIRNCDISWIGGSDQYGGGGNGRRVRLGNGIEFWGDAHDNLVENNRLWEIYDAAITNQGAGLSRQYNITYRNNEIWNSEYSFEYWNRGTESFTKNILFENNNCRNAGYGWGHSQRPNPNGRHLMFFDNDAQTTDFCVRNNSFKNAVEGLIWIENDWLSGLDLNHNRYEQFENGIFIRWIRKSYSKSQWDTIRAKLGIEKDGTMK